MIDKLKILDYDANLLASVLKAVRYSERNSVLVTISTGDSTVSFCINTERGVGDRICKDQIREALDIFACRIKTGILISMQEILDENTIPVA